MDAFTSVGSFSGASLSALLLTSMALMGSPGPATISVTAMAAAFGARRSCPYLIGIILGTTLVLAIVASGLTGAVLAVPFLSPILIAAAALYILYLAYKIATAPPLPMQKANGSPPPWFGGFLLAIANPKAYAAIAAVFAGNTIINTDPVWDAIVKFGILTLMVVVIHIVWLFAGGLMSHAMTDPRKARMVNMSFATALIAATLLAMAL